MPLCPPLQYSNNMTASKQLLVNFTSTSSSSRTYCSNIHADCILNDDLREMLFLQQSGMMRGHVWGSTTGKNCTQAKNSTTGSMYKQGLPGFGVLLKQILRLQLWAKTRTPGTLDSISEPIFELEELSVKKYDRGIYGKDVCIPTDRTWCEQGFFRRSIQQKIHYRACMKNQLCLITRINRNRCQYCR